jgi:bifunctional DNase/RNase
MKKIELEIIALSQSIAQSQSYAVVLGEVNGLRKIPIIIGSSEAQAIALALEKMHPSRPLTHDLMKNMMVAFGLELHEVVITDIQEGVFFSKLLCTNDKDTIEIDSRTSDAIALAIRFGAPIYTYESIIETAGDMLDKPAESPEKKKPAKKSESSKASKTSSNDLSKLSLTELNTLLNEVLENEDYARAIAIRDEINSRTK